MKNLFKKNFFDNKKVAILIAYLGLTPFLISSSFIWIIDYKYEIKIIKLTLIYAYLIFTFIGAVYWGMVIKERKKHYKYLILSILPTIFTIILISWDFKDYTNLIVFLFYFNFFLLIEKIVLQNNFNLKWYFDLRIQLNVLVTISLSSILLKILVNN